MTQSLACQDALDVHYRGAAEIFSGLITLSSQAWPEKEVTATDCPCNPGLAARVIRESSISLLSADSEKPLVLFGSYGRVHADT